MFIVSDHGMGPLKFVIDLNSWLFENNFMYLKNKKVRSFNLNSIEDSFFYRPLRKIYISLHSLKALTKLRDFIWKTLPKGVRSWKDVDWKKSRAYSIGTNSIFVNLKGREPEGIVEDGKEYETVLEEITKSLYELKDPDDNKPVVKKVWWGRNLYKNVKTPLLPDIFIEYRDDSFYSSFSREAAPNFKTLLRDLYTADHKRNTIFCSYGIDIKPQAKIEKINIFDVVPTILHNMNIPIPEGVDGKVIICLLYTSPSPRDLSTSRMPSSA